MRPQLQLHHTDSLLGHGADGGNDSVGTDAATGAIGGGDFGTELSNRPKLV